MGVYLLDKNEISFPHPRLAEENGLLAVGGDLSVHRLLFAYTHGIFPWYNPGEEILWWCPHAPVPHEAGARRGNLDFR